MHSRQEEQFTSRSRGMKEQSFFQKWSEIQDGKRWGWKDEFVLNCKDLYTEYIGVWYLSARPCFSKWSHATSLVAQTIKRLPTMSEIRVQSLGQEDPLEKEMATHSSILAWKMPWKEGRSLVGYRPWGRKESDTTEWLHFNFPVNEGGHLKL